MDILNISNKTFFKLISVCLLIAIVTGTLFYFTKGGFFDGILLTFVGLSLTYLTLILSILIFKSVSNILAKDTIKVSHVIISFIVSAVFAVTVFVSLFKIVAKQF